MKRPKLTPSLIIILLFIAGITTPLPVGANIADWQKSASFVPNNPSDFSSENLKTSLKNFHTVGGNYATLIIPLYQDNINSTNIYAGWNTPTETALTDAINYAHSLGFQISIKIHLETQDGTWRAQINPADRTSWFNSYGSWLKKFATVAQTHHAEQFVMGAELYHMTSSKENPTNTTNWQKMITDVRTLYSGSLTYSAQRNDNFGMNELDDIGFWENLDYIGLSAYYPLAADKSNPTVDDYVNSWSSYAGNYIFPRINQLKKPLIITEVGYRSTNGTHREPWDFDHQNGVNQQEQADLYQAFFQYWGQQKDMHGVSFWDWSTNPKAGGTSDTGYTPQNKEAQHIIAQWFRNKSASPATAPTTSPSPYPNLTDNIDIWWPSNNSILTGSQSFKAMITGLNPSQYKMYWQVDNGTLNEMNDNHQDYPHKEDQVDVSSWYWHGSGPYVINYTAKDLTGKEISSKSISISVSR
jgi:hypothetical protein